MREERAKLAELERAREEEVLAKSRVTWLQRQLAQTKAERAKAERAKLQRGRVDAVRAERTQKPHGARRRRSATRGSGASAPSSGRRR